MSRTARLVLKKDRERPVLHHHPWLFSGAIMDQDGDPEPGATVEITNSRGEFLAWGAYSPTSQIRARIWSWNPNQRINSDFFQDRLERSISFRNQIGYDHSMRRLVHAESDGLPGLIVDQYGEVLVIQVLSAGIEFWKDEIVTQLADLVNPTGIYERSDVEVRTLEGLNQRTGILFGSIPGDLLSMEDDGFNYRIDYRKGHKTGAYLDQRLNRQWVGAQCAGKSVLDCFSYTGGFSLHALRNGAKSVTLIDNSAEVLKLARKQIEANHLDQSDIEYTQGDVFKVLRGFRDRGMSFDVIVLDPPKFAPTASLAQRAARGYKDINLLAMKLINRGGLLATFSCSGGISRDFFLRVLSGAAHDAGVNARIQIHMGQSMDHSVNLRFPEGTYLKGFAIRVDKEEV